MSKFYKFTRKQLRSKKASDFKHGDAIEVSNYLINIAYKSGGRVRSAPTAFSWVENAHTFKALDCTPGVRGGRPYYIDDFLHR
jgi:hypothetical protein